jgi:hypothetical protein
VCDLASIRRQHYESTLIHVLEWVGVEFQLNSTYDLHSPAYLVLLTPSVLHILERFCEGFLGISSHNKSLVGVMFVCILLLLTLSLIKSKLKTCYSRYFRTPR